MRMDQNNSTARATAMCDTRLEEHHDMESDQYQGNCTLASVPMIQSWAPESPYKSAEASFSAYPTTEQQSIAGDAMAVEPALRSFVVRQGPSIVQGITNRLANPDYNFQQEK